MRFHRVVAILTTVVVLVLSACGPAAEDTSEQARVLELGVVLSTSGPAAAIGSAARAGLDIAVDDARKAGDFEINVHFYDDRSDPNETARVIQQLADVDGAHAIVGPSTSPACLRVGSVVQNIGIPAMTPTATNVAVTAAGDCMSRVCFIDPVQGEALAVFSKDELGLGTATILIDRANDYSVGLAEAFKNKYVALGGVVVAEESYTGGDSDFAALIAKVARYEAEVLFIPGWYSDVGPMLKQAGDKWDKFVLLGGDAWDSPELFDLSGGNIRNAYVSTHFAVDDPDPRIQEFVTRVETTTGSKPSGLTALGYDAGLAVLDAARRTPTFSRDALKASINSTSGLVGVTGVITLDAKRDALKPVTIVEVKDGGFAYKARIMP